MKNGMLSVFAIVLVDVLGMTIILPLLPLYATAFGADPLIIGLLAATYPLAQLVGAPVLGHLSDRYGRKPVLLFSQLGTLLGFLLLGFANSLWLLLISRLIDGLSGANLSTAQAVIADRTDEASRTRAMGLIGAAFGLGFTIGPLIAYSSLALTGDDYHAPAFIAAGCSLLSIILTWFLLQDKKENRKARTRFSLRVLLRPQIAALLVILCVQQIAFGGFEQLLSLFTLNRLGLNAASNAIVFLFVGILLVAEQGGMLRRMSHRWSDTKLIYLGLAALSLGLALIALTPALPVPWYSSTQVTQELHKAGSWMNGAPAPVSLPGSLSPGWFGLAWRLLALVPVTVGGGILRPTLNSLVTKRVEPYEIGAVLGICAGFVSASNAVGPVMGGALFQDVGSSAPFLVWGIGLALLLLLARQLLATGPTTQMTRATAKVRLPFLSSRKAEPEKQE